MTTGLKVICGLYALLMAVLGARWWFAFEEIAAEWVVQPLGEAGINNLFADMGSLFFGSAIMIGLGLRAGHSVWLLATALLMAIAALGRIYGYAVVAYTPETIVPLTVEILSCALLVFTHQRMSAEQETASG